MPSNDENQEDGTSSQTSVLESSSYPNMVQNEDIKVWFDDLQPGYRTKDREKWPTFSEEDKQKWAAFLSREEARREDLRKAWCEFGETLRKIRAYSHGEAVVDVEDVKVIKKVCNQIVGFQRPQFSVSTLAQTLRGYLNHPHWSELLVAQKREDHARWAGKGSRGIMVATGLVVGLAYIFIPGIVATIPQLICLVVLASTIVLAVAVCICLHNFFSWKKEKIKTATQHREVLEHSIQDLSSCDVSVKGTLVLAVVRNNGLNNFFLWQEWQHLLEVIRNARQTSEEGKRDQPPLIAPCHASVNAPPNLPAHTNTLMKGMKGLVGVGVGMRKNWWPFVGVRHASPAGTAPSPKPTMRQAIAEMPQGKSDAAEGDGDISQSYQRGVASGP